MKLIRLSLHNFKGLRDLCIDVPEGNSFSVFGDNATGKTTIADSFFWLLFGKDSQGRTDFEIKTLLEDGSEVHKQDHSVEGRFLLPGGDTVELSRVYREKYTTQRGSAEARLTGHTTDYFINGVPVQKKDYDARVAEICDERIFRLLTDPYFFNVGLDWKDRRRALLEICGDVEPSDVIERNPDLKPIADDIKNMGFDAFRKVAIAERKKTSERINVLPNLIAENKRNLDDFVGERIDPAPYEKEIERLLEERNSVLNGADVQEKKKRIAELDALIAERKTELTREANDLYINYLSLKKQDDELLARADDALANGNRAIERLKKTKDLLSEELDSLRKQYAETEAKTFTFDGSTTCDACGRELPEEQVAEAEKTKREAFNEAKSRVLEATETSGKIKREEYDKISKEITDAETALKVTESARDAAKINADASAKRAEEARESIPDPLEDETVQKYAKEKHLLGEDIGDAAFANEQKTQEIDRKIQVQRAEIALASTHNGKVEAQAKTRARIEELEAEHKSLSKRFETIEKKIFLSEEWIRVMVSLLTDRINARFKFARFKLFDVQVNEGIREVCETTYDGVPYGNLNSGTRLNVGLDVISTLADHHLMYPPIFIDNAESVTDIMETPNQQQVRLIVSKDDTSLRFEGASIRETTLL